MKRWVKHEVWKHAIFVFLNSDVDLIPIARSSYLVSLQQLTLGSTQIGNLAYGYDNDVRRLPVNENLARTGLPLAVSQTAYNANNQLTQWGTANLFYDLNGNMTSDGTHSYSWDARNRLSQIDSGNTASFSYDPFGRRTSKTILGTQTGFLYDRANPVQELAGSTVTANLLTGGVDEYFSRTDSSGARHFLTDALGSTLALTDSTGTTQTSYTFEPFGNTTVTGSSTTNSFGFTGRELDATGLYYYRARYYSPSLQRFISEDPLGFRANSVNFYEYTYDNPQKFRDPSGRQGIFILLEGAPFEVLEGEGACERKSQDIVGAKGAVGEGQRGDHHLINPRISRTIIPSQGHPPPIASAIVERCC